MPAGNRIERLEKLVQEKIGGFIIDGTVKDPRVDSFLSVTRVELSRDLSYADVFISSFKTEEGLAVGVEGLQSAAGFIQAKIATVMRLRQTPRLRFHADSGLRLGFELNKKIDALVKHENAGPPANAPACDDAEINQNDAK